MLTNRLGNAVARKRRLTRFTSNANATHMGAAVSAGELPPWAQPSAEETVKVVWRDAAMGADDPEDREAAALRKKARRDTRARRRAAESLPGRERRSPRGASRSPRPDARGEKTPSPRKELLPPVESPTLSNEFAMQLITAGEHGNDGARMRLRSPKLPDEQVRRKGEHSDKENPPRTSPTKRRTPKHLPSPLELFELEPGREEKQRKREKKKKKKKKKKDDSWPRTSPTKHRSKHGPDGSESGETAKGGWGNTDRYKKPEHWKYENRATFGEYKEARGWDKESERKSAVAFLNCQAAKRSELSPVTPPPTGVLLVGDKALAVKLGKSVGFGDTDVLTYQVDHYMRRRRTD